MTRRSSGVASGEEQAQREIVISRSRLPVVRAGSGLLLIPMTAILATLVFHLAQKAFGSAPFGAACATASIALGATYFAGCVARLSSASDGLRILRSFDEIDVPFSQIVNATIWAFRPSRWIVAKMALRGRRAPLLVHFVVASHTNKGGFDETVTAVRAILKEPFGDRGAA